MSRLATVGKWVGIYLICNAITVAAFLAYLVLASIAMRLEVPASDRQLLAAASHRAAESYLADYIHDWRSDADNINCSIDRSEEYSSLGGAVTCSVYANGGLVEKNTYLFTRDGAFAGTDPWQLETSNTE